MLHSQEFYDSGELKTQAGSTGQVAVGCSSRKGCGPRRPYAEPQDRRPGETETESKVGARTGAHKREDNLVQGFP